MGERWLEKHFHFAVDTPLRLLQAVAFHEVHSSLHLELFRNPVAHGDAREGK